MDKQTAIKIIRDTFERPFDKGQYVYFIRNLFNKINEDTFEYHGQYITDSYKPYIKKYERIGKYSDSEGNKIDILIVNLKKETSLERARTMQRNFIAQYLKERNEKDAAVVAFHTDDMEDWRFSLVKMEYKLVQTESGRIKAKEELTPARRYSFLVGKNEPNHTAQSRLYPRLKDDINNPTLAQLEDAFNIETVTEEFFENYRDLFIRVREAMDDMVKKYPAIREDFAGKRVDTVDFAKKLMGQIVFLYFLQKKGWFGVEKGKDWGTGSKRFLRDLYDGKIIQYKNFFNDILEPLFYDALARDRSDIDHYNEHFKTKIPFLNGGLFDPINNYDWVNTDILLPDELFSNDRKTRQGDKGDGILDIFDRYNFTVREDEPLEKEVAIDPEMLGKVFENLLEVKDRKSKGSYYTPREIVHYMCQESLINYLITEISPSSPVVEDKGPGDVIARSEATKQSQLPTKEDTETLIHFGDFAIEHDIAKESGTKTYKHKLSENIRYNAKLIDEKLENIRVCDPAVGSGAFLVGMMTEIVRARNVLTTYLSLRGVDTTKQSQCHSESRCDRDKLREESRSIYNFKRHCIRNCLYGVDIDPGAVEIAKLRLWLSLVVDEEDIKQIKPLPNLDYKIVCGNSLLGVKVDLFNMDLFSELERLKPLLFNETNTSKKQEYKKQIDGLISKITNGHKEFDFQVYFSEVFHEKKGFDVVIANPPYVSYGLRGGQKMTDREKEFLRKTFPNSAEYKISLYAIFMDKAIQIAKPIGGLQTFIVPDSFLLGRYFSKIRKFILQANEIISILLLPYGVFQATVGFSVVYLFQKRQKIREFHSIVARFAETNETIQNSEFKSFAYPQNYFNSQRHNRFRLFFDEITMCLISKIENNTTELGTIIKFSSGLIGKNGQESIISKQKKNNKWLNGIVSGGEINRYVINQKGYYLLYDKTKIKSGYDCVDYFKEKLFMRQTGDSLICAFDKDEFLALNNVHIGNLINTSYSLKFIIALINSRLMNFYYRSISLETGRVMAQTDIETIDGLPIKKISEPVQQSFITLVDQILADKKKDLNADTSALERQIDEMVYKLYGLTNEEIRIVEGEKN